MDKKEILTKARALKPILWIGKNGITDAVVEELKKLLKKKGIIKIKFLRNFIEDKSKKEIANEIAELSDSELVMLVGFTIVLKRKGNI